MTRRRLDLWLRLFVATALAGLFAAAIAPHLDAVPEDLSVPPGTVLGYLALLVPYHVFRAGRWAALIRPLAPDAGRSALWVALAGYMWVALLPFRLGELARPLFLQQRTGTPVARSLGSIAVERIVDGLAVCACFFGGLAVVDEDITGSPLTQGTLAVVTIFAAALLGVIAVACAPVSWQRKLEETIGRLVPRLRPIVSGTIEQLVEGLRSIATLRAVTSFLVLTACYWGSNIVGMWYLAVGCGLDLTLGQSLMVLAVMNVALLLPGGPAQFGIFQTGLVLGLALFLPSDVIEARGSVFAFYLYTCQIGTITLAGLASQHRLKLDWRAMLFGRDKQRPSET